MGTPKGWFLDNQDVEQDLMRDSTAKCFTKQISVRESRALITDVYASHITSRKVHLGSRSDSGPHLEHTKLLRKIHPKTFQ